MKEPAYCVISYTGFPGCRETLASIPDDARILFIDSSINEWPLSRSWNYAIDRLCDKEGYPGVVICNDDIILKPDTGDLLLDALTEAQFIDERAHKDRELLIVSAYNTRDHEDIGPRWGTGPDFSCFIVGKKFHDVIGRFDENFPLYFEDNDAHRRIQLAGFQAMSFAPYFHHGSGTMKRSPEVAEIVKKKFEISKDYYIRKWGNEPHHETFRSPFSRMPLAGVAT